MLGVMQIGRFTMEEKLDLEDKLKQCCDILDSCAMHIRNHEIEPVQENTENTKSAINEITDILLRLKSYRETLKEPWQPMCTFCKLKESQVWSLFLLSYGDSLLNYVKHN